MAKVVKDVRGFSVGEVNPVSLSLLDNDYPMSCKKLTNCVVNMDGSVQVRKGFESVNILPDGIEVLDISFFETDKGKKFIYLVNEEGETKIKWTDEYDSVVGRMHDLEMSEAFPDLLANHGLERFWNNRGKIVKIKKIKDKVFVFYENCFPFRIEFDGDETLTAYPFYFDIEDTGFANAFKWFPSSFNTNHEKRWGNMVIEKLDDEPLWDDTSGDVGKCKIRFEGGVENPDLKSLIGHPIHFNIRNNNNNDIQINDENPENWIGSFRNASFVVFSNLESEIESIEEVGQIEGGSNIIEFTRANSVALPPAILIPPYSNTTVYGYDSDEPKKLLKFTFSGGVWSKTTILDLDKIEYDVLIRPWEMATQLRKYKNPFSSYRFLYVHNDSKIILLGREKGRRPSLNLFLINKNETRVDRIQGFKVFDSGVSKANVRGNFLYELSGDGRPTRLPYDNPNFQMAVETPVDRYSDAGRVSLIERNRIRGSLLVSSYPEGYENFTYFHFVPSVGFYISSGRTFFKTNTQGLLTPLSQNDVTLTPIFRFSEHISFIDDNYVYYYSGDRLYRVLISSFVNDFTKIYRPPPTPLTPEEIETRQQSIRDGLLYNSAKEVFAGIGFRFFTVFPYEVDGNSLKCRLYAIGFRTKGLEFENSLGGSFLQEGGDVTDNYIVSDWYDKDNKGWPIEGGNVAGKDFFLTNKGKLSYSAQNKPGEFGHPIKTLFRVSGFNYKIGEAEYSDFQRVDFQEHASNRINDFFDLVDKGEDAIQFTIGDPFTYQVQTIEGEKVKFLNFTISEIGAFASAGAQSIAMTDKGVFYWGINPRLTEDVSSFVNIGKVSKFIGSEKYKAMVEVLDRIYVTDKFGDLFVVVYNQANRNFVAIPSGTRLNLKNMAFGVPYLGNRFLGIDSKSKKLYCVNSDRDGMCLGASEWELKDGDNKMEFELVKEFNGSHYALGFLQGTRYLMKVNEERTYDNIVGSKIDYEGLVETTPCQGVDLDGSYNFRAKYSLLQGVIFSKGLQDCEVGIGGVFNSVRKSSALINQSLPEILRFPIKGLPGLGEGITFKLKGDEPGCLCGASISIGREEDR